MPKPPRHFGFHQRRQYRGYRLLLVTAIALLAEDVFTRLEAKYRAMIDSQV